MIETSDTHVFPVRWQRDQIILIDQRRLPNEYSVVAIHRCEDVVRAIRSRIVQGSSALGIAAAYGIYLGACEINTEDRSAFLERLEAICETLKNVRPDKENLRWAVVRMLRQAQTAEGSVAEVRSHLLAAAQAIQAEDFLTCHAIGDHGVAALPDSPAQLTLYTHCNHGALATSGYGTSLGVVRSAWREGRLAGVYAGETRPNFQGSRLTAWECVQEKIPVTIVTDSMAAYCIQQGLIHAVLVGADRIAANGDTINKIGTYSLALAAKAHNVPFFVAAPLSTVDFALESGQDISVSEGPAEAIYSVGEMITAPEGARYYNPSADVTPANLITAFITEQGAIAPSQLIHCRVGAQP
ncbi:MAG: S-methyl-5-thioribose-1-phosphate isomerase [Cyanobacteria bacterium Co-bin8]|nr:S-methyl-5-thioribose-1-phosphate isomerase [Cyanobacteria bacterium Co-bin8]